MLIFAHTGLTLGASVLVVGAVKYRRLPLSYQAFWVTTMSTYLDIRLLLIGSMLPDIIDKPLGLLLLRDSLSSGRIYAHTLLFFVLIITVGLLLYWLRQSIWMLILAVGTFTHLLLDEMWAAPKTLFWPLLGLEFERIKVTAWLSNILEALRTHPEVYIPEFIGFISLVWFGLFLIFRKQLLDFIKYGKLH